MQAWIDDSGAKGQGGWMTLGGLAGKAEDWAEFSDRWNEELHACPKIDYFSTREAMGLRGEFHNWRVHQRDAKTRRLATIAKDYNFTVISAAVELCVFGALKERLAPSAPEVPRKSPIPKRRKTFSEEPYFFLFHAACSAVCLEMVWQGVSEEIDLFFDNQDRMKPQIKEWYPMYLSGLSDRERAIMPPDLVFRDDKKFLPLQMSDFVSWIERTVLNKDQHPFGNTLRSLKRLRRSRYCSQWDMARFEKLLQYRDLHKLTEGEREYTDALRKYLGLT
jgi:hypothetical protein